MCKGSDDAKSFFIGRNPISSKDSIIEFLKNDMAGIEKGIKFSFTTKEVHVSNDGINVTEIGEFKLVDSTGAKIESGNYFSLFEKILHNYIHGGWWREYASFLFCCNYGLWPRFIIFFP